MGRPSKLTPSQWDEIAKRIAGGESKASLSREYGISQGVLSQRFSEFPKEAIRKLGAELALLQPQAQAAAVTLADELRSISGNLAAAARYGSATAHRLQALAHGEVQKIDDANPLESVEALKGVAALTRLANESSATGLALLAANRESKADGAQPVLIDRALAQV
jgi:hypothetical protein